MRKILLRLITLPLAMLLTSCAGRCIAYGAENNMLLNYSVTGSSGMSYGAIKDALFVNESVRISSTDYLDAQEGSIVSTINYYLISYDHGISFDDPVKMEEPSFCLSTENDGDEFYIKLKKEVTYLIINEDKSENATENSGEEPDNKDTEETDDSDTENDNDADKEKADNTFEKNDDSTRTITEEYFTEIIHIIFDFTPPSIEETKGIDFSGWTNQIRTGNFKTYDNGSCISRIVIKSDEDVVYEYHYERENGDRLTEIFYDARLDKEAIDETRHNITVFATDNAGNTSEKEYIYYLDMTKPVLVANGINNNTISNGDLNVELSVTDNIISLDMLSRSFTKKLRDNMVINPERKVMPEGGVLSYSEDFTEDGEYVFSARAFDAAGNESSEIIITFRIDKSAPQVKISGFENGRDYKKEVGIDIFTEDDFYEDSVCEYEIIKRIPGSEKNYLSEKKTPDNYSYKKSLILFEDGDYEIKVNVKDAAGNVTSKEAVLRIDKTAPFISLSGIEDKQVVKNKPVFFINGKELFYDTTQISAEIFNRCDDGSYVSITGKIYEMESESVVIPFEVNEEGSYLLYVSAKDRAGNESECTLEFTFDCSAPKIGWLSGINKKYLKSFKFPVSFLSNIADKTSTTYKAYLNAYELSEGTEIKKDGKYVIKIIATDMAGNVAEENAEFIIDATPPRIVVKGMKKDGNVKTGDTISLSLFDKNDRIKRVTLDGTDLIPVNDGKECNVRFDSSGEHRLRVIAADEAGNETDKLFVLSASAFKVPKPIEKTVTNIVRSKTANTEVNINKNFRGKYIFILIPLIIGICVAFILIYKRFGHIDVSKLGV